MKSYDYDAVTWDAEVYCLECVPAGVSLRDVQPIFASDEWDTAPVCCVCGAEHDYMSILEEGEEG